MVGSIGERGTIVTFVLLAESPLISLLNVMTTYGSSCMRTKVVLLEDGKAEMAGMRLRTVISVARLRSVPEMLVMQGIATILPQVVMLVVDRDQVRMRVSSI